MTDKEKIRKEVERLQKELIKEKEKGFGSDVDDACILELQNVLTYIDSLQEEPVSDTILLYGLSGSVGIEEAVKETEEYKEWQGDPERQQSFIDFAKFGANYKHKTSKDLEEAAEEWDESLYRSDAFIAGAQWQKEHLWKDAQGDDLPEIDKEVIALIEAFGHYKVIFAHRVDENAEIHTSIDGKPLILHPKRHGKGGWNIPDVKFWLDCELPKMEE